MDRPEPQAPEIRFSNRGDPAPKLVQARLWRVCFEKRVAIRQSPSTQGKLVGAKGNGHLFEGRAAAGWVEVSPTEHVLIDATSLGLEPLLLPVVSLGPAPATLLRARSGVTLELWEPAGGAGADVPLACDVAGAAAGFAAGCALEVQEWTSSSGGWGTGRVVAAAARVTVALSGPPGAKRRARLVARGVVDEAGRVELCGGGAAAWATRLGPAASAGSGAVEFDLCSQWHAIEPFRDDASRSSEAAIREQSFDLSCDVLGHRRGGCAATRCAQFKLNASAVDLDLNVRAHLCAACGASATLHKALPDAAPPAVPRQPAAAPLAMPPAAPAPAPAPARERRRSRPSPVVAAPASLRAQGTSDISTRLRTADELRAVMAGFHERANDELVDLTADGVESLWCTSDMHIDYPANRKWLETMPTCPKGAIIVAGDLCSSLERLEYALAILARRFLHVFYTFGNHELWWNKNSTDTDSSVSKVFAIERVCRKLGVHTGGAVLADGLAVLPLYSWYKQSLCNETLPFDRCSDIEKGFDSACFWPSAVGDPRMPHFSLHDGVADFMLSLNEQRVAAAKRFKAASGGAATVVTFSHFIPRSECFNGYSRMERFMGCNEIDRQARAAGSSLHVFGHSHLKVDKTISGVRYVQCALGYPNDWNGNRDGPMRVWRKEKAEDGRGVMGQVSSYFSRYQGDVMLHREAKNGLVE